MVCRRRDYRGCDSRENEEGAEESGGETQVKVDKVLLLCGEYNSSDEGRFTVSKVPVWLLLHESAR